MKLFRTFTALMLALVLLVVPVMQASAAGKTLYISEIRIGYGDEGEAALVEEGFTVWTDLNANEEGNGSSVWLGYKTTTNADEAITDVALMNMWGGYSFDAYSQEIDELNRKVSEQLASFKEAIAEFRTNHRKGSAYAVQAYELMNLFYDDDTTDANGNPMGLGDIFLKKTTSDETLQRIFLEGNTEAIAAVETALAIACIETEDSTVLTRIADSEYPDELDPEKNAARSALKYAFADFHSAAIAAKAAYEKIDSYEGGAESFFGRQDISEDELSVYLLQYSKYLLLSETPFGNTGMTLLDFALLDETEENEYGDVLEDEYLEILAQSMTDGQLGIVAAVGIMTVLMNAASGENADEVVETYQNSEAATAATEATSVYCGVDRSLFEDIDSIALTSDALREKAAAQGNDFGKLETNDEGMTTLQIAATAVTTFGIVATMIGASGILDVTDATAAHAFEIQEFFYGTADAQAITTVSTTASVAGVIMTAVGVIAIIAGVVLLVFAILEWIEKPEVPNTKYTQIPRVIVDKDEETDSFTPYYAAKLAGAEENETDSTKLYGDLNALNGIDQWLALYYTKDASAGVPLTAELLISSDGTLAASQTEKYAPVHMFGSASVANLNQYNTAETSKAVYIFLRKDSSAVSQSGSVFTTGTVITGLITFACGAALAAAVTYLILRKKKVQITPAENAVSAAN